MTTSERGRIRTRNRERGTRNREPELAFGCNVSLSAFRGTPSGVRGERRVLARGREPFSMAAASESDRVGRMSLLVLVAARFAKSSLQQREHGSSVVGTRTSWERWSPSGLRPLGARGAAMLVRGPAWSFTHEQGDDRLGESARDDGRNSRRRRGGRGLHRARTAAWRRWQCLQGTGLESPARHAVGVR